jgi:hypothetical protein
VSISKPQGRRFCSHFISGENSDGLVVDVKKQKFQGKRKNANGWHFVVFAAISVHSVTQIKSVSQSCS